MIPTPVISPAEAQFADKMFAECAIVLKRHPQQNEYIHRFKLQDGSTVVTKCFRGDNGKTRLTILHFHPRR